MRNGGYIDTIVNTENKEQVDRIYNLFASDKFDEPKEIGRQTYLPIPKLVKELKEVAETLDIDGLSEKIPL
ncbi:hypothetical protein F7734_02110 [Scytonema sp. UIC 10036]|uniref:hypothetical protein n=1 Tax=Scytonema sp. UIC 10036 TaxID=2304196 RepID=UPI0012DA62FA|nr:hypothetical protein [Scytonema sp. UIC 10036]MUG91345.1 hypothetical protein [Scytonema sp. UIC 10036]